MYWECEFRMAFLGAEYTTVNMKKVFPGLLHSTATTAEISQIDTIIKSRRNRTKCCVKFMFACIFCFFTDYIPGHTLFLTVLRTGSNIK